MFNVLKAHRLANIVCVAFLLLASACATQEVGLIGGEAIPGGAGNQALTVLDPQDPSLGAQLSVAERYALAIDNIANRAYASDRRGTIHIVDSLDEAPAVSSSPLAMSHTASALAVRYPSLIVAIGTRQQGSEGVVSTSVLTNSDIDEVSLGSNVPYAVDVCDDNETILVGLSTAVRKFTVDDSGSLTDTGELFNAQNPLSNVYCAPGSETAVVVSSVTAYLRSFDVSSMNEVDVRESAARSSTAQLGQPIGLSSAFAPDGQQFYVRSERGDFTGDGFVESFSFTPNTGALGSNPDRVEVEPFGFTSRGVHHLALSLNGERLFVTEHRQDRVRVFDASSLTQTDTLTGPGFENPLTIVIGGE